MSPFGRRLAEAMATRGPLCVGIDPHPALLAAWGLTDDPDGVARFADACVAGLADATAVLKPQSAFFERHGSRGIAVLERTIADARSAGALVVVDAKRGDIGSTMSAYADAYLNPASPLAGDAVTLSPYLGYESLRPALDAAIRYGRGVFVLGLTSNPQGAQVQHARPEGGLSVAASVVAGTRADNVRALSAAASSETEPPRGSAPPDGVRPDGVRAGIPLLGPVGLVVGATIGTAVHDLGLDLAGTRAPLLAPGIGAQGAGIADLARVFGPALPQVIASVSRQVLQAGPAPPALCAAARQVVDELRAALVLGA
ncbi:MAG: orotidine-5'-phosphate decarboxylase [Angustibacter sp.]